MGGEEPLRGEYAWEPADEEEGGDPVCWAHLVCPECGAIETEGHRDGCELAGQAPTLP